MLQALPDLWLFTVRQLQERIPLEEIELKTVSPRGPDGIVKQAHEEFVVYSSCPNDGQYVVHCFLLTATTVATQQLYPLAFQTFKSRIRGSFPVTRAEPADEPRGRPRPAKDAGILRSACALAEPV